MAKNLKYFYFEVLHYVYDYGIGIDVNIIDLCSPYAHKKLTDEHIEDAFDAFSKKWNEIINVLESLKKLGYIKYSTEYGDFGQLYMIGGNFSISITKEGLDYYYTHELRKATLRSFNNQFFYNFITWGIALLAVSTTIYTTIQKYDLNQKLQELNTEVQQLKYLQHSQAATHKIPYTIYKKP